MAASPPSVPTDAELPILRVLWDAGPSTVRAVMDRLPGDSGYTTVLKHLQIMHDKGLVDRDESSRAHVYRAAVDRSTTEAALVRDLQDRAFGGSARRLVMHALSNESVSPDELDEIRSLLDQMDDRTHD